ncbi:MAG: alternative ribosome rescue aminoacyl-tRNA hydrolase ArfB [Acidimicrobiales bacterium]
MATDGPLHVNGSLTIPASDLTWKFGPSGGPGGQHANTANTRAELVFEIATSESLNTYQRDRLEQEFGPRLRIVADEFRSQTRNREAALERMADRLADALKPKRVRRATRPGRGAKERRLKAKRQRSEAKARRSKNWDD